MDNLTHALLGATCGRTFFHGTLGRRAVWWGAVANLLPDLDTAAVLAAGPLAEWRYHRGLTHSLWFGPLAGAVLGLAVWRWYGQRAPTAGRQPPGPWPWVGLFVLNLLVHPLLDAFTSYGTQLLWPFSRQRFAWDAVAIIDPFFTGPFLVALLVAAVTHRRPRIGFWAGVTALALSSAFLFYGLWLNRRAESEARRQLAEPGLRNADVHAYPTLLQPWLRRVVARDCDEVRVGWLSVLSPRPIAWQAFRDQRTPVVEAARRLPDARMFEWFAMGQTAARAHEEAEGWMVEIDDLRYGFPGRPEEGLWGIRARLDREGRLQEPVERVRRARPRALQLLGWLWNATFPS